MRSPKLPAVLAAFLVGLMSTGQAKHTRAEGVALSSTRRIETGMGLRFMPVGWFDLTDASKREGFRAYPALGIAPFIDYRVHRYVSIGFSPEITLNVIPNRADYYVGKMFVADARLQARYPNQWHFEPYAIVTGGYSVIWRAGGAGSAKGPTVGGMVGCRVQIGKRHAIFGEVGYQKGFQTADGGAYGPSYVITGAGWQLALGPRL
jgi:hypothetical protein